MNANEPAMTIISPMNAGMLVLVVIGNKYLYLYLFCVSYINRFLVSILWHRGLRPRVNLGAVGWGANGGAAPHKKVLVS